MLGVVLIPDGVLQYFTSNVFPLAALRLRFFWYVFPQDRQLLGCFFGRWFLIIPCSFSFCSDLAARFGCSFSLQVCSLLATHLPLRQVFFWPAILTPRYPVSGTPLPLRHVFFWPAILTPRYPLFRYPRAFFPLRRVLVSLTGYLDAQVSFFPCPTSRSATTFWVAGSLLWRLAGLRFPVRFLPLHHDFSDRSAVFWPPSGLHFPVPSGLLITPAFAVFLERSALPTPSCFFPGPTFPSRLLGWPARSLCRLAVRLRFLPLRGFYRSAVFTAPRFLSLRFHRFFWGLCSSAALMLAAPQSSPTSGRLALCVPPCGTPAFFTAPRILPLRGFYRSAVFTAPRFLPLRVFYRSAVFTAPPSPVFWGLCSSAPLLLAAPQSSSSSGRTLWCRLVRSVSGGPPFLTLFLYRLLNHSRSVTAHLTGFPFVHFIQIRGPSIVSSFGCRDTGTACTSTSLWNLTAHGNKAFSPQTDGSAVCRYAYWSMKWLYLQMARSQSVVWFPPTFPRYPLPRSPRLVNLQLKYSASSHHFIDLLWYLNNE